MRFLIKKRNHQNQEIAKNEKNPFCNEFLIKILIRTSKPQ